MATIDDLVDEIGKLINVLNNNGGLGKSDDFVTLPYGGGDYVSNDSNFVLTSDVIVDNERYGFFDCCFDPGTKILMADGTEKNIEDVEVGDMVMSLNEDTGEYIAQRSKGTIINKQPTDLIYDNE